MEMSISGILKIGIYKLKYVCLKKQSEVSDLDLNVIFKNFYEEDQHLI